MDPLKQATSYAKSACNTMIRTHAAACLPPKGRFHYHQGVFLSGMYKTYLQSQDERYFRYIKDWVDSIVDGQGAIVQFDPGQLDDIQPGTLLFPLYEKTGDRRYKTALDTLMKAIDGYPKNEVGGFFHKSDLDRQMWLDGLYMGGPICAEYAYRFHRPDLFDLTVRQAELMEKYTKDSQTGLWYHAWDPSGQAAWADPQTGRSSQFWGRSIGWVPVALLDDLDYLPEDHPGYPKLAHLATGLLTAVCRYQSSDGRWYQVVDKPGAPGNWLENSCTCLFAAALAKAVRKGFLEPSWLDAAGRGYEGVIRDITWDGDDLQLGNVCVGTGVGDYQHYCNRPASVNDLHGIGAFLIMCAEMAAVE